MGKCLDPWSEAETSVLMEWVDAREKLWDSMINEPFQSLDYDGQVIDPLEGSIINQWFRNSGLFYGAGYGRSLKPVFFLGGEERRVLLFPEIFTAYDRFFKDGGWKLISRAAAACRDNLKQLAWKLIHVTELLAGKSRHEVEEYVEQEVLAPLGLGRQES